MSSLGEKGALFSTEQGCWLSKPLRVKVRGSVGAGDSTVGAVVAAMKERGLILPEYLDGERKRISFTYLKWEWLEGRPRFRPKELRSERRR